MKLVFLNRFLENTSKSNFMEIHPVGAGLFHADERPEGHRHNEGNSHFSQFCNTPKNVTECFMIYSLSSILPLGIEKDTSFKLPTDLYLQRTTSLVPHMKTEIFIFN